jgi:hypothetical protein
MVLLDSRMAAEAFASGAAVAPPDLRDGRTNGITSPPRLFAVELAAVAACGPGVGIGLACAGRVGNLGVAPMTFSLGMRVES